MQVTEDLIKELQAIMATESGRGVSFDKADQIGNGLVGYFNISSRLYHDNKAAIDKAYETRTKELPLIK